MLYEEFEVLVGSYSPVFVSLLLQFPMRIREYVYSRRCAVRTPLTIDGLKLFSCFYSVFYCTVLIVLQCTVLIYFIYNCILRVQYMAVRLDHNGDTGIYCT